MLDLARCVIMKTAIVDLGATAVSVEEGTAMVFNLEGGVEVTNISSGAAGEVFAGFSQNTMITPTKTLKVEKRTVPATAPYTVKLARTPSSVVAERGVFNDAGAALTNQATISAAGDYNITGDVLTVHSSLAGKVITINYLYDISAAEAIAMHGNDRSFLNSTSVKSTTNILEGVVFTNKFDPAINWGAVAIGTALKLGAGGVITTAGSGATIDASIVFVPTATDPYLGLRIK